MRLTLVAAIARNYAIGLKGQLPWHLPSDLAHFKALTIGKPILMGRLTYESIGRPLPKRRNLVLTRSTDFSAEGVETFDSIESALEALEGEEELMVIGGGQVYRQALSRAGRIHLTVVHSDVSGDAFFPRLDAVDWMITHRVDYPSDSSHEFPFSTLQIERSTNCQTLPKGFPILSHPDA